jgi:hypothetical protein
MPASWQAGKAVGTSSGSDAGVVVAVPESTGLMLELELALARPGCLGFTAQRHAG